MEIQHFSHQKHPLVLRDDKIFNIHDRCRICQRSITAAPFYACDSCKYYIHKSCAELPRLLNHSFHPSHLLTLEFPRFYYCNSCHRLFSNAPTFRCDECNFNMDVECAKMAPITFPKFDQNNNIIQHPTHQHPMPRVEMNDKDVISCLGCRSTICSGDQVYGCTKCMVFLHKSCAELPQKIEHPLHDQSHGLLTIGVTHKMFFCKICNKASPHIFTFRCHHCGFTLCMKCFTLRGTIKYEDHEHLLCCVEKSNTEFMDQCDGYESYCKRPIVSDSDELKTTSTCVLRCLDCDFKLHLLCGPLPYLVKHECHIHSLVLVDSLVEDDTDEYFCDVCENKREPRIRVYYCESCKYVAHVSCVTSEIINLLTGELRDVELKTKGPNIWKFPFNVEEEQGKSLLILKDLINTLTRAEQDQLRWFYKWAEGQSQEETGRFKLGDEDINRILELSHFTSNHFEMFIYEMDTIYKARKMELRSSDLAVKLWNVDGYKIPYILAPVLKTLLHKYGDVSSEKMYSTREEWKSILYFILSKVLKEMSNMKVVDITRSLLHEWYFHLKFLKYMGFKVDFACAHLERLVRAFLGVQATRLEYEIPMKINQKMVELEQKMMAKVQQLQEEIAKLQEEITEERTKLEKCREFNESSAKSKFIKDCLKEGLKLKWKDASEDLFTYQEGSPILYVWDKYEGIVWY